MKAKTTVKTIVLALATGLISVTAQGDLGVGIQPCPAIYISTEASVMSTLKSQAYKAQESFSGLKSLEVLEAPGCLNREVRIKDHNGVVSRFLVNHRLGGSEDQVQLIERF